MDIRMMIKHSFSKRRDLMKLMSLDTDKLIY